MKYQLWWRGIGWIMVAFIISVSLDPSPPDLSGIQFGDKFAHTGAYLVLMAWLGQCYPTGRRFWLVILLVTMGIGLEFIQGWSGYRTFDFYDMAANTLGVVVGWGLLFTRFGKFVRLLDAKLP